MKRQEEEVGIREAKANLSSLVARVRKGLVVTITDRGRPAARLVPVESAEATLDERVSELRARGWIIGSDPAHARAARLPEPAAIPSDITAQEYLQRDRDG